MRVPAAVETIEIGDEDGLSEPIEVLPALQDVTTIPVSIDPVHEVSDRSSVIPCTVLLHKLPDAIGGLKCCSASCKESLKSQDDASVNSNTKAKPERPDAAKDKKVNVPLSRKKSEKENKKLWSPKEWKMRILPSPRKPVKKPKPNPMRKFQCAVCPREFSTVALLMVHSKGHGAATSCSLSKTSTISAKPSCVSGSSSSEAEGIKQHSIRVKHGCKMQDLKPYSNRASRNSKALCLKPLSDSASRNSKAQGLKPLSDSGSFKFKAHQDQKPQSDSGSRNAKAPDLKPQSDRGRRNSKAQDLKRSSEYGGTIGTLLTAKSGLARVASSVVNSSQRVERPYSCSDCMSRFPVPSKLKRHLLSHIRQKKKTGAAPFKEQAATLAGNVKKDKTKNKTDGPATCFSELQKEGLTADHFRQARMMRTAVSI